MTCLASAAAALVLLALPAVAAAGTFGGFGNREDGYLVGRDRICKPLAIAGGKATGAPSCRTAAADEVAKLSVKPPTAERGPKATFAAEARGRALTVRRKDGNAALVAWESPDPITRVIDVYASPYGNLVAVELSVRRGGRDLEDVVAFDLRTAAPAAATTTAPPTPPPAAPPAAAPTAPVEDKAVTQAVVAARKVREPKKAIAAWAKVLTLDADHSEARYATAVAHARQKRTADALAALEALASSQRSDAVEWRVEARFDAAFAALRADPRFRAAVGLDRPAQSFYERLMGFGGKWWQAGTSCEKPNVSLTLGRDRTFELRIESKCSGADFSDRFRGRWAANDPQLVLILPNKGRKDEEVVCAVDHERDEDAVTCALDADLSFTVRPVRR